MHAAVEDMLLIKFLRCDPRLENLRRKNVLAFVRKLAK